MLLPMSAVTALPSMVAIASAEHPMSKKHGEFHKNLESEHFAKINFPMGLAELNLTAGAFLDFLALPDQIKRQLHFPARTNRASADGFTDKTDTARKDPKQFFHWSPHLRHLAAYQLLQTQYTEVAAFFDAAEQLYKQIETVLSTVFNQHLIQYRALVFEQDRLIDGILRFLCYAPRPEHSFCARAHFDKGFSTLAVADSAPGLRIGCCNNHPLKAVQYGNGTALFLPAWMLFQASNGAIKPAWHDVIHAPEEQDVNAHCARWSIVFFINSPGTPFSSWNEVHTPLH